MCVQTQEPTPDGHRAPIAEMLRCGVSTAATCSVDTDALWCVLGESAHLRVGDTSPTHTYSTIHIQVSSRATLHIRPLLHMYIILYLK